MAIRENSLTLLQILIMSQSLTTIPNLRRMYFPRALFLSLVTIAYISGQDESYPNRIFLIYDGIHYDPLAGSVKTIFPVSDEATYAEALILSKDAREVYFSVFSFL